MLSAFVSSLASLLSIIALISSNKHENEILAWGVARDKYLDGSYKIENYFLGVTGVHIRENYNGDYTHTLILYDSDECKSTGAEFCDDCTDAFRTVIAFTALFFIFTVFSVAINLVRRFCLNSSLTRGAGTVSSLLCILWGLIALNIFASDCFAKFIDEAHINKNTHHFYGGGFAVLATAICLMFIEIVINWLIVPLPRDAATNESKYEQPAQQKEAEMQSPDAAAAAAATTTTTVNAGEAPADSV